MYYNILNITNSITVYLQVYFVFFVYFHTSSLSHNQLCGFVWIFTIYNKIVFVNLNFCWYWMDTQNGTHTQRAGVTEIGSSRSDALREHFSLSNFITVQSVFPSINKGPLDTKNMSDNLFNLTESSHRLYVMAWLITGL